VDVILPLHVKGADRQEGGSMNRSELLESASQYIDRVIILLTLAGEDRLAQDIEEIVGFLELPELPSDTALMPRIDQYGLEEGTLSAQNPIASQGRCPVRVKS
jgi:hypothetical protein